MNRRDYHGHVADGGQGDHQAWVPGDPLSEIWRPIPGTHGWYLASTRGRIRSVDALICRRGDLVERPGRVLRNSTNKDGYPMVRLFLRDGVRRGYVHDLVAKTFIGPKPTGLEMRHLDDVKTNCNIENLRYGTRAENIADRRLNGIRIGRQKLPI